MFTSVERNEYHHPPAKPAATRISSKGQITVFRKSVILGIYSSCFCMNFRYSLYRRCFERQSALWAIHSRGDPPKPRSIKQCQCQTKNNRQSNYLPSNVKRPQVFTPCHLTQYAAFSSIDHGVFCFNREKYWGFPQHISRFSWTHRQTFLPICNLLPTVLSCR